MLNEERHQLILDMIEQKKTVTLHEIIDDTNASTSTIRRDLSQLEQQGLLKRVHGGATTILRRHEERNMIDKEMRNQDEKRAIAKLAVDQIKDGDTIYLDAGTTTLEMIPHLYQQDIIVVTNGLTHVKPLLEKDIKVYLTGGEVKYNTFANVGVNAVKSLERYRFDKSFIGMNGIDLKYGLTTPDPDEAIMKEKAIGLATTTFILADHTKFNDVSFTKVECSCETKIITSKKTFDEISNIENFKEKFNIHGGRK